MRFIDEFLHYLDVVASSKSSFSLLEETNFSEQMLKLSLQDDYVTLQNLSGQPFEL